MNAAGLSHLISEFMHRLYGLDLFFAVSSPVVYDIAVEPRRAKSPEERFLGSEYGLDIVGVAIEGVHFDPHGSFYSR